MPPRTSAMAHPHEDAGTSGRDRALLPRERREVCRWSHRRSLPIASRLSVTGATPVLAMATHHWRPGARLHRAKPCCGPRPLLPGATPVAASPAPSLPCLPRHLRGPSGPLVLDSWISDPTNGKTAQKTCKSGILARRRDCRLLKISVMLRYTAFRGSTDQQAKQSQRSAAFRRAVSGWR